MLNQELWRVTIDTNPEDCNLKCIMCEEHSSLGQLWQIKLNEVSYSGNLRIL